MSTAIAVPGGAEFDTLYRRSRRRAFNHAYRLTHNAADAEDVVQDSYVRALRNFDSYDRSRSFEGWLFRIITNRVIDMRRRRQRVPMYSMDAPVEAEGASGPMQHEFADEDSDPQDKVLHNVMDERLQTALDSLSPEYRTALELCDVQQLSYQEIADRIGVAIGTVRSRIHRARLLLRKRYLALSRAEDMAAARPRQGRLLAA